MGCPNALDMAQLRLRDASPTDGHYTFGGYIEMIRNKAVIGVKVSSGAASSLKWIPQMVLHTCSYDGNRSGGKKGGEN
jgi:hypothetical protein